MPTPEHGPDLRGFMRTLEVSGERIVRVSRRVSSIHELSAVVKLFEKRGNPVLLFENVDESGPPVVVGLYGSKRRIATALGTEVESAVATFLDRLRSPISPRFVADGPIKEVHRRGKDVDLNMLPIPIHAPKDGGRYITAGICMVRDEESGVQRAGIYRLMIKGRNRIAFCVDPGHGLGKIIERARQTNSAVECAVVIGYHPTLALASQAKTDSPVDVLSVMGAFLREPVWATKCESVDIYVPANAEIVLEGQILPGERESEGPFGEFSYYYGSSEGYVCEITGIMKRDSALYLDIHPTHSEHRCLWIFPAREARLLAMLRKAISGVRAVHIPLEGAGMVAYISLDKEHDGDATSALMVALQSDMYMKHAVVVDPDVDIFDLGHMLWALALRFQADTDLRLVPFSRGFAEDPSSYCLHDRHERGALTTKTGFDATAPIDRPYPDRADLLPEEYADINLDDYLS